MHAGFFKQFLKALAVPGLQRMLRSSRQHFTRRSVSVFP
jgi:hypothetical protein